MKIFSCLIVSLLLISSAHAADKQGRVLNLAGNAPNLVRWSPVKSHHSYQEQLPQPDKIAAFEKLGYGSATLSEQHQIMLRTDKTVEETVTNSQLYINSNGIENAGNNGFWIDTNNQRAEIKEAYVLQPDGAIVQADPGTIQVNSDNLPNIFNDLSYVTVPFSQLKPGSIAILVYKIVSYHDKLPLPWSRLLYPANFGHIESFQARINWADEKQKPVWQTDYAKLDCKEGLLSLTCTTKEASAPIPTDKGMPSIYDVLPVLVLTTPASWAEISNSMQTLTEPALSKSEKIKDLAENLIKDTTKPEEKMSLLKAFVSREIRYVGIEHGHNGVVPRPTLTTLERRFGDCKDKTMLFVDLARQAGLDAYPVLTSTKRQSLAKLLLPSSNYFNHMIACVKLTPDKESCVDLTDPETSAEHLPYSLHDAVSLKIGRETIAPGNLAAEPYTWVVEIKADNRLTEDGVIVETLERSYNSHWAAGLRYTLASKSQADRDRWLIEDYRSVMSDKLTPTVRLQGLDQPNSLVVMTSTTEFRNAFNPSQLTNFSELDPWLRDIVKSSKTTNSHYPYTFQGLNYQSQLTYKLNQGKRINNLGPAVDYDSAWGSFHRYYRKTDTSVTAFTELKMSRAVIPVEKIVEFNRFLDLSSQETRIWFSVQ